MSNDRKMRWSRNDKGFTFIELIIVISMLAIISSGIFYLVTTISYMDPYKAATMLNHTMEKVRMESMSKADKSILYIYNKDDVIYFKVSSKDNPSMASLDAESGTKLGKGIHVNYKSEGGVEISLREGDVIYISFEKSSGAFATDIEYIKCSGRGKQTTLYCIKETGRRLIQ